MMKIELTLIVLLLSMVFGCGTPEADETPVVSEITMNETKDFSDDYEEEGDHDELAENGVVVHRPAISSYQYKVILKEESEIVDRIEVYDGDQLLQTIDAREAEPMGDLSDALIIEDVNFDGYPDLRIMAFMPAGPNVPYYFWIWDSISASFKVDEQLEELSAPEFDQEAQKIFSYWRDGCCRSGGDAYEFVEGVLTLMESNSIEFLDDGRQIESTYVLEEGTMKLSSSDTIVVE